MRILHTEWSDGMGGQEKRVLSESLGLARRGHYVALVCRDHSVIKTEAAMLGIDVHTLPLRKPYDIESIVRLAMLLTRGRFDIVNTHSGVDSWIGGLAARLAKVPVLARTRHLNIPLKRNPLNFIHYLPDVYITCGENMRTNLTRNCGFPAERVVSIPTGVDSSFFHVRKNNECREKYGIDRDAPVITNVGILRSVKGHEVTFNAVRPVLNRIPHARFLIVGDGPRKEALEKLVREMGISDHVIFTGFVKDIPEIYSMSDVSILSSWSEGLPQSLLQSMASGVPVVATKVGGVPEVVIHERTGLLVEPGDHEGLAESIIRLLQDNELSAGLARNAREFIISEHSLESMVEKLEGLYKELLRRKSGAVHRK